MRQEAIRARGTIQTELSTIVWHYGLIDRSLRGLRLRCCLARQICGHLAKR